VSGVDGVSDWFVEFNWPRSTCSIEYLFGVVATLLMGLCMLNMEGNRGLLGQLSLIQ